MAKVATTSTVTGANPISLTAPTGITSGDLLVLVVSMNRSDSTYGSITTPTGFTLLSNTQTATTIGGNNSTINSSLFYKVAGGSEPGSYSIATDTGFGRATMVRITGWYSGYTFTDYAANNYSSGTSSATANAFTVTAPALSYIGNLALVIPAQNGPVSFSAAASGYTLASEVSGTATPSQNIFSTQVPTGTSFPVATVTPGSTGAQANTIFFLAIPTDRVIVTPLSATGTINSASFVRVVIVSALNATFTLGTVTAGTIGRVWANVSKSVSSWVNTSKS